ncbi:MAG TPA: TetR/AcrR family transcriptional regulator [Solirubrobacteraceae bacterium]|nr:TetR/AcrR family transcriptional regulator [Solirubrobacteraceae bacterium]
MSSFSRADARRNGERILNATAELLATDPSATLEHVATRAGVSRTTVYHHFANRDALLDALTEQSVHEVKAALDAARPDAGSATAAMERLLRATWQVVGRYRGLVIVNPQRLERSELRARLEPALAPVRAVIGRGQRSREFDPELPVEWLLGILTDVIHAASRQVSAGTMSPDEAERVLLRSARALLTSHRRVGRAAR